MFIIFSHKERKALTVLVQTEVLLKRFSDPRLKQRSLMYEIIATLDTTTCSCYKRQTYENHKSYHNSGRAVASFLLILQQKQHCQGNQKPIV